MWGFPILFITFGMFFYLLWRGKVLFGWNIANRILGVISIGIAGMMFSSLLVNRQGGGERVDILKTLASRILVGAFVFSFFCLIEQIISHRYKITPRIFLGIVTIIFGIGNFFALHTTITPLEISSEKITDEKKFLVVSDIHVDFIFSTFHLKKIKNLIETEKPDAVLFIGDLFNKAHPGYEKFYKIFEGEETPLFAVMGNHDIMGDKDLFYSIQSLSPIKILANESIDFSGINLVGILDKSARKGESIDEVLHSFPLPTNNQFTIFLTHQPLTLDKIKEYSFDLELAGHTHRGQFYGLRKVVEWVNGYGYGRYDEYGKTAFVTQGIGTRGLPFRLGTQSEIVLLHLMPKN